MSRLERDPSPQNLLGMVVWAWLRSLAEDSPVALVFMLLVSVGGGAAGAAVRHRPERARALAAGL